LVRSGRLSERRPQQKSRASTTTSNVDDMIITVSAIAARGGLVSI
jgi:hypothetical protein